MRQGAVACTNPDLILFFLQNGAIPEPSRMPVNLSIKNAPDDLVASLKARAQRNHRSMQREMLAILDEAVSMRRRLTPDEVLAKARQLGLKSRPTATAIVRSDRDRR
jgi:antitoxin FitA